MAESAVQTISMTSSEVQALEAQIGTQTLTAKLAARYFPTAHYGTGIVERLYATASQVRQLAQKGHGTVKGVNPFGNDGLYPDPWGAKPLQIPEGSVCEFCGRPPLTDNTLPNNPRLNRQNALPQFLSCSLQQKVLPQHLWET